MLGKDKKLFDGRVGTLPKVLEAYMGEEVALLTNSIQSIFGNYALGCCTVTSGT